MRRSRRNAQSSLTQGSKDTNQPGTLPQRRRSAGLRLPWWRPPAHFHHGVTSLAKWLRDPTGAWRETGRTGDLTADRDLVALLKGVLGKRWFRISCNRCSAGIATRLAWTDIYALPACNRTFPCPSGRLALSLQRRVRPGGDSVRLNRPGRNGSGPSRAGPLRGAKAGAEPVAITSTIRHLRGQFHIGMRVTGGACGEPPEAEI